MPGPAFRAMCAVVVMGAGGSEEPAARCPSMVVKPAARALNADCVRIAGSSIGQLPLEVAVAGRSARFTEWAQRDVASGDVIGFRLEKAEDVVYAVEAGRELYSGAGPTWIHPAGVVGPRVQPIGAVTLCRMPQRPDGCVGPSVIVE